MDPPLWYQDTNGLSLEPCLADATGFADPLCVLPLFEPNFDPTLPIFFPNNFPSESFYWTADTMIPNVGPNGIGSARFRMALEAAFATPDGNPAFGQQITFLRIDFRPISGLVPGATYTVMHPFGQVSMQADATGTLDRFRLEDSSFIPGDFASLLPATLTKIGPFLTWTDLPPGGLPLNPADPSARYIGDSLVLHTITPGPQGAAFRIEGQDIGGPGINSIQTDLWTVAGRMFTAPDNDVFNISGIKFNDLNANGIREQGEPGVADWTITLTLPDGTNLSTMTESNGNYVFHGLQVGTYTLTEEMKAGWVRTFPPGGTHTVNLTEGDATGIDFGNFKKGKIAGIGIIPADGRNAAFGLVGLYLGDEARGAVRYQDPLANLNIKSIQINTVATTTDRKKGVITGLAKVNGEGSFYFEIHVEDNGESGKGVDVFRISLPAFQYSNGAVLGGGNIRIQE